MSCLLQRPYQYHVRHVEPVPIMCCGCLMSSSYRVQCACHLFVLHISYASPCGRHGVHTVERVPQRWLQQRAGSLAEVVGGCLDDRASAAAVPTYKDALIRVVVPARSGALQVPRSEFVFRPPPVLCTCRIITLAEDRAAFLSRKTRCLQHEHFVIVCSVLCRRSFIDGSLHARCMTRVTGIRGYSIPL